jgi:uncharacterized protein with von Willebrand factor type A (vWA) domain
MRAIDELGVRDRESFRLALLATLVKDSASIPVFAELFPLFFDADRTPPLLDLSKDLTPEEASLLAQALRQLRQELQELIERLLRGEPLSPAELDQLGQMVGLNQANDLRYREWMAQRMEKALKFREVQQAIRELMQTLAELGLNRERIDQIRGMLAANQRAVQDQIRQFAGSRIAEQMSERPPEPGIDSLMDRPFHSLTDKDLDRLRKEVQRLAAALKTRVALRQKRSKRGQLDAKATIRANLKHGSVPIEIRHKDRTLKPKLVVVCDISTSMRACSELMLCLLHAMQDQISKTHAFAYIDHLEYITPDFQGRNVREAVLVVLERMPPGHYSTDLGYGLLNFTDQYFDRIDSRSTFIVVGDGRNNYNDPRCDLFSAITRRANRTIWINPESPGLWGTGDSDMLKYAPYCNEIFQAGTLAELTAAIDRLLVG